MHVESFVVCTVDKMQCTRCKDGESILVSFSYSLVDFCACFNLENFFCDLLLLREVEGEPRRKYIVCKVRKYKTLLFMKNKGSLQIQMLPSEIVNSNIKLLYLWYLETQAKPHTTQVEVQVFYEAFQVLLNPLESYALVSNQSRLAIASHHQTVAIMAT